MKSISERPFFLTNFLVIIALLGLMAYLQLYKGFAPCPLCILQRFALALLGAVFFIGAFIKFKKPGLLWMHGVAIVLASFGALLAGRQVWLQHMPSTEQTGCGASLDYMMQVLPLKDVLQKIIFDGSAECSQIGLEFLHISLAGWSLLCFLGFILLSIRQFRRLC